MPVLRGENVEWSGTPPSSPSRQKPAVGQIEVDLFAQPPLGSDAEAIADDQHPDHQLGIDRWPTKVAVERGQFTPQVAKFDLNLSIDRKQMIGRNA